MVGAVVKLIDTISAGIVSSLVQGQTWKYDRWSFWFVARAACAIEEKLKSTVLMHACREGSLKQQHPHFLDYLIPTCVRKQHAGEQHY